MKIQAYVSNSEDCEKENLVEFCESMTPLQRGKVIKELSKLSRRDGIIKTKAAFIRGGAFELLAYEENKIQPMTTKRFFRSTALEQRQHEEKVKKAGTKTVYLVDGWDVGKIAYEYAKFLIQKK